MDIMTQQTQVVQVTDADVGYDPYDPYVTGQLDARDGKLCVPENYWIRHIDLVLYCLGYAAEAGETRTTRFFTGTFAPLSAEAIEKRRVELNRRKQEGA